MQLDKHNPKRDLAFKTYLGYQRNEKFRFYQMVLILSSTKIYLKWLFKCEISLFIIVVAAVATATAITTTTLRARM